jgi:hypothetical protein
MGKVEREAVHCALNKGLNIYISIEREPWGLIQKQENRLRVKVAVLWNARRHILGESNLLVIGVRASSHAECDV